MSENLEEVFSRLSVSEEERMDIMGHVGPLLRNSGGDSNMGKRVANLDLNVMFLILGSASSEDELILACQTLQELLSYLEPTFILERYADAIERGFSKDTHVQVKIMVLRTLQRMKSEVQRLGSYKSILSLATSTIADPELSLAKESMDFLLMISSTKIDLFFSDSVYPSLLGILDDNNSVNQLRVYELFIKIGSISQELLNRVVETTIFNRLLKMAYSDDVLVKLNVLELLGDLAATPQGYQFIVRDSGISSKLDDLLDPSNDLSAIILPGILKFFGSLAYVEPKLIFSNHPKFLTSLQSGLKVADGRDPFYRASVETLGVIVRTSAGRKAIEEALSVTEALEPIVEDIRKGSNESRVLALDVFADFVDSESSQPWFSMLGNNDNLLSAPAFLLQLVQLPFNEVQMSAYKVLGALSQYGWGSKIISEHPGFMEFLLNRDSARTKEIKESKFKVIRNILNSGDSASLVDMFGTPCVIKMKEYVRDGPFYVRSEANVAFEEAS